MHNLMHQRLSYDRVGGPTSWVVGPLAQHIGPRERVPRRKLDVRGFVSTATESRVQVTLDPWKVLHLPHGESSSSAVKAAYEAQLLSSMPEYEFSPQTLNTRRAYLSRVLEHVQSTLKPSESASDVLATSSMDGIAFHGEDRLNAGGPSGTPTATTASDPGRLDSATTSSSSGSSAPATPVALTAIDSSASINSTSGSASLSSVALSSTDTTAAAAAAGPAGQQQQVTLECKASDMIGILVLLAQSGGHRTVADLGKSLLKQKLPTPLKQDLAVAVAISQRALARERGANSAVTAAGAGRTQRDAQAVAAAAQRGDSGIRVAFELLESALAVLKKHDVAPLLQQQFSDEIGEMALGYATEVLRATAQAGWEAQFAPLPATAGAATAAAASGPSGDQNAQQQQVQQQRTKALELLKSSLWVPSAEYTRPGVLRRLEGVVTAAEQMALYSSAPDSVQLRGAELYNFSLALIAEGYVQRWPPHISHADQLLERIQAGSEDLDVSSERSVCALLLGRHEFVAGGMFPAVPLDAVRLAGRGAASGSSGGVRYADEDGGARQWTALSGDKGFIMSSLDGDLEVMMSGDPQDKTSSNASAYASEVKALYEWAARWIQWSVLPSFLSAPTAAAAATGGAGSSIGGGGSSWTKNTWSSSMSSMTGGSSSFAGSLTSLASLASMAGEEEEEPASLDEWFKSPTVALYNKALAYTYNDKVQGLLGSVQGVSDGAMRTLSSFVQGFTNKRDSSGTPTSSLPDGGGKQDRGSGKAAASSSFSNGTASGSATRGASSGRGPGKGSPVVRTASSASAARGGGPASAPVKPSIFARGLPVGPRKPSSAVADTWRSTGAALEEGSTRAVHAALAPVPPSSMVALKAAQRPEGVAAARNAIAAAGAVAPATATVSPPVVSPATMQALPTPKALKWKNNNGAGSKSGSSTSGGSSSSRGDGDGAASPVAAASKPTKPAATNFNWGSVLSQFQPALRLPQAKPAAVATAPTAAAAAAVTTVAQPAIVDKPAPTQPTLMTPSILQQQQQQRRTLDAQTQRTARPLGAPNRLNVGDDDINRPPELPAPEVSPPPRARPAAEADEPINGTVTFEEPSLWVLDSDGRLLPRGRFKTVLGKNGAPGERQVSRTLTPRRLARKTVYGAIQAVASLAVAGAVWVRLAQMGFVPPPPLPGVRVPDVLAAVATSDVAPAVQQAAVVEMIRGWQQRAAAADFALDVAAATELVRCWRAARGVSMGIHHAVAAQEVLPRLLAGDMLAQWSAEAAELSRNDRFIKFQTSDGDAFTVQSVKSSLWSRDLTVVATLHDAGDLCDGADGAVVRHFTADRTVKYRLRNMGDDGWRIVGGSDTPASLGY